MRPAAPLMSSDEKLLSIESGLAGSAYPIDTMRLRQLAAASRERSQYAEGGGHHLVASIEAADTSDELRHLKTPTRRGAQARSRCQRMQ